MESDEKPGKGSPDGKARGKGSRKKKDPQPPLQAAEPLDEGMPVPSQPGSPAAPAGDSRGPAGKAGKPLRAADIMTEDPVCCTPETPVSRVARLMAENSCGAIPVIRSAEDRTPVGVVTDRDVAVRSVAQGRNPLGLAAADVMTQSPVTVGPTESVEACARLMRERRVRRLVVVDGHGRVSGLLALAQIALHLPHAVSGGTLRDISRPGQEG